MQNNALVRIFAILFVLVSIYQLSFTFISSNQEKKAKTFAKQSISDEVSNYLELRDKIEGDYLDSVGQISLYGITSYNDAKNKELNKGLDLKGGINVILQISIKDILKGLAENTRNIIFINSLEEADNIQKNSDEPYIESFFQAFDNLKGPQKLSDPEIFEVHANQVTAAGLANYANSITLTPGTVTVDINEAKTGPSRFLVHALHPQFGDDVRSGDMDERNCALERVISGRLEKSGK